MIDLHSHLLPCVDEGASSLEEGLALLEVAIAGGITTMVLTPRIEPGRFDNNEANLRRKFDAFCALAVRRGLAIELRLGGEAVQCAELLPLVEAGQIPFVGNWSGHDVLLMQWREAFIPVGAVGLMQQLLRRRVLPMLAHPERNPGVVRSPQSLEMFIREGCMVQIDAASVLGRHGADVQRTTLSMIEKGWVSVMASNAHSAIDSPGLLAQAFDDLVRRYGDEYANALVLAHPAALLGIDPTQAPADDMSARRVDSAIPTLVSEYPSTTGRSGFVQPSRVSVH